MKLKTLVAFALAAAVTAGCATNQALLDAKKMIVEGRSEEALAILEQSAKEHPEDVELRAYLFWQRDVVINRLLTQAGEARAVERFEQAEALYNRVLAIDSANFKAKSGLVEVTQAKRHLQAVNAAASLIEKNDFEAAEAKLRTVAAENPDHRSARDLLLKLEKQKVARQSEHVTKSAFDKPVTLEFREASMRSVFEVISRTSGINFVFDKDVRPDTKVTIFVRNSTIEDVIKLILTTNQLERKTLNENSILIYPNTPAKQKEYQELMVKSFYLTNTEAKQASTMIKTMVKTKDVFVDEKLNLLVIKDTPEAVQLAEKLIQTLDLAEPEVMLDVEILEVKRSKLTELGIQYPNKFTVLNIVPAPTTTTTTGGVVVSTSDATTTTTQLTLADLSPLKSSQIGIDNPALNLKSEASDTNILANPRIRVKNQKIAKIHIGDKVPVITTSSTANVIAESVSYLDVGLKLDVEPSVSLDDEVSMKVSLEVSNIVREIKSSSGTLTYQLGTRNASTNLRLKNGETQVLAGLINDEDRKAASKIPGLGDIPLLGRLFSSHKSDSTKTEIVLLITPHIIRNISRPGFKILESSAGTAESAGSPPLRIGSTDSGALSISVSNSVAVGGNAPIEDAATVVPEEPPILSWSAPAQTTIGSEFLIGIDLSGSTRRTDFDIVYDPTVLAVASTGGNVVTGTTAQSSGRASVGLEPSEEANTSSIQLRFKVVSKSPLTTEIRVENIRSQIEGVGVPTAPPPLAVTIVQ